jgi:Mrp family chromosome partitioning ATPase/capsular polysaccharide biosynthesis protein
MIDHYWKILLKRWKLLVICFVVTGLAVFAGSALMTPMYQSTAFVQVAVSSNNSQADINGLLASDQLVQTESQLAISDPVLREVASHYAGLSVDQLAKNTSTSVKTSTQLFQIDVLDASPQRAAALANDIARTLIKQQTQASQQHNTQSQQQIQQDLNTTQLQIESVSGQIATLKAKNGNGTQISTLQVELNGLQQHFTQWQSLLAQLELTQAQAGNFLLIAQNAQPALSPARPNVRVNTAIGLVIGLLDGFFLAILLEQLDTRVRSVEELTKLIEWPVLATVWRPDPNKDKQEDLVNPPSHSPNVEAYRILRTNLGFALLDKPVHTIMVTSAVPAEGKSTTAANLAIFMAKAGKKTLLIDADMRRPTIAERLHLPKDKLGLSNAIVACAQSLSAAAGSMWKPSTPFPVGDFSLNAYTHAVNVPNLKVMPAGPLPPNPPDLLDSRAMESFQVSLASSGAEVIIFDAPPLLGLSDASILASKVDGVLVVINIERADKKQIEQMKAHFTQAGTRVLGCIVNKQRRNRKDSSYYSYYYYRSDGENKSTHNSNTPVAVGANGSVKVSKPAIVSE